LGVGAGVFVGRLVGVIVGVDVGVVVGVGVAVGVAVGVGLLVGVGEGKNFDKGPLFLIPSNTCGLFFNVNAPMPITAINKSGTIQQQLLIKLERWQLNQDSS
jgi:hypothetical protein